MAKVINAALRYMKELYPARVIGRKHEVITYSVNGKVRRMVEEIPELSMDDVADRQVRRAIEACDTDYYPDVEDYLYRDGVKTESKSVANALNNLCNW